MHRGLTVIALFNCALQLYAAPGRAGFESIAAPFFQVQLREVSRAGHGADPFFFDRKAIHPPLREILHKYLGVSPLNLPKP